MSLEATGYRYEVMRSRPTPTRTFTTNQEVQQHEWSVKSASDHAIREREKWNERLDEIWWRKRINRDDKIKQQELTLANQQLCLLRREKMKQLYNQEYTEFEKELSQHHGKTFYKKRM